MSRLAFVSLLLAACRPTHVTREITAFVVYAVNRMIGRWTWPDFSNEGWKIVNPSAMEAKRPITIKTIGTWIETAILHALPDMIFGRFEHAMPGGNFLAKTAARFGLASAKIGSNGISLIAAITAATPPLIFSGFNVVQNNPTTKAETAKIRFRAHIQ
jgi:hypothetical protein